MACRLRSFAADKETEAVLAFLSWQLFPLESVHTDDPSILKHTGGKPGVILEDNDFYEANAFKPASGEFEVVAVGFFGVVDFLKTYGRTLC